MVVCTGGCSLSLFFLSQQGQSEALSDWRAKGVRAVETLIEKEQGLAPCTWIPRRQVSMTAGRAAVAGSLKMQK